MTRCFLALTLAATVLSTAAAQPAPRIGRVDVCRDGGCGESLYFEDDFEDQGACPIFRSDDDVGTIVRIDGVQTSIHEVSRRTETAHDASAGVTRRYTVRVYRPRSGRFEVETWTRYEALGYEHGLVYGGLTIRKAGRTTTARVRGTAGC